ncbi:alpha/beta hydrolase [Salibacterium lacus]|uniref:Alpha/beta hydrolase n=1 Tax=Salibacterium lacus TaxID=1898109 RepID=A0ABW5T2X1_9BACI
MTEIHHPDSQMEEWLIERAEGAASSYKLYIYSPSEPAPSEGYPVLYVLDGNAFFQTVSDAVRMQSRRPEVTGVHASVVVGIGYPGEILFHRERRFYDYTPSADTAELPPMPSGSSWPENGGAERFLLFLRETIQPFIREHCVINPEHQTIFGHSLGGLFALYTLFNKPGTFQGYIATSPSIWWNQQAVLQGESPFLNGLGDYDVSIRLFLSAGSLEKAHMITDAKALSSRLKPYNTPGFQTQYIEGHEENHMSIVPTILSRALRFTQQTL